MARAAAGVCCKANIFILWQAKPLARPFCKSAGAADDIIGGQEGLGRRSTNGVHDSTCWVPHPRSGIYVPKGQEWVINDVPDGAASFGGRTFWLRTVDGVEKPDPDTPSDHYIYSK